MSLTYVVVNLGRTKFVSTVIKDWVVFYVTLPRFWVGNLLNVNSEMRWVGFTLSNFRIVQDSLCWTNAQLFDDLMTSIEEWLERQRCRMSNLLYGKETLKKLPTLSAFGQFFTLIRNILELLTWGMENCKLGKSCWQRWQWLGSSGCHLHWRRN